MRANRTLRFFTSYIISLPQLSLKEKKILLGRLKTITLENIGSKYNVTEAPIRQIEKQALKKVKVRVYQMKLFKS